MAPFPHIHHSHPSHRAEREFSVINGSGNAKRICAPWQPRPECCEEQNGVLSEDVSPGSVLLVSMSATLRATTGACEMTVPDVLSRVVADTRNRSRTATGPNANVEFPPLFGSAGCLDGSGLTLGCARLLDLPRPMFLFAPSLSGSFDCRFPSLEMASSCAHPTRI